MSPTNRWCWRAPVSIASVRRVAASSVTGTRPTRDSASVAKRSCGTTEGAVADSFVCKETDFDAQVTVNGKLVFNPEATTPPGNFITPIPQCDRGYLIGWVINSADRPIKFDG